jgi:intracellular sulfur oxidation DsrE/DsrF family protein
MTASTRRTFAAAAAATLASIALPRLAQAQTAAASHNRALFQVSDNDPARWNLILSNVGNLREGVGGEGAEIEIVAFGPGLLMLKGDSPVKQRVADALKQGVRINACQNTMHAMKLAPADMLPEIGYVPSGVVEVMKKQQQGWSYIRT